MWIYFKEECGSLNSFWRVSDFILLFLVTKQTQALEQLYVTASKIRKKYDVSTSALRLWAEQGKIKIIRNNNGTGKRLYCLSDFENTYGVHEKEEARRCICYARVSSAHQHADLERQCADFSNSHPTHELIKDTGSGLNWKRPGLLTLLDAVCAGSVSEVVVTYRDRLARIGVELLEWLFAKYQTKLVVLNTPDDPHHETDELRDDLLAIVTFFVARNNRRRSAANRQKRKRAASQEEEDQGEEDGVGRRKAKRRKIKKSEGVSECPSKGPSSPMVWYGTMDIQPMPNIGEKGQESQSEEEGFEISDSQ